MISCRDILILHPPMISRKTLLIVLHIHVSSFDVTLSITVDSIFIVIDLLCVSRRPFLVIPIYFKIRDYLTQLVIEEK